MNFALKARWKEAFVALWQTLNGSHEHGIWVGGKHYCKLVRENCFERASDAFALVGAETWEAGRRSYMRDTANVGKNQTLPRDPQSTKLLRIALALASDRLDDILPHERGVVEVAAPHIPWLQQIYWPIHDRAPRVDVSPSEPTMAEVSFAWIQQPRRGVKRGFASSSTHVPVKGLSSDEAPIVMRLATPEGGWIDVRRFGEEWLRPVLSPGSWEPCTTGRMFQALKSGEAWRDSPTGWGHITADQRNHRITDSVLSLDDMADRVDALVPLERRALTDREDAIRNACDGLYSIGGMAWRRGGEPKVANALIAQSSQDPDKQTVPLEVATWRMGDLNGLETQKTLVSQWLPVQGPSFWGHDEVEVAPHMENLVHAIADERNRRSRDEMSIHDQPRKFEAFVKTFSGAPRKLVDLMGAPASDLNFQIPLRALLAKLQAANVHANDRANWREHAWLPKYSPKDLKLADRACKIVENALHVLEAGVASPAAVTLEAMDQLVNIQDRTAALEYVIGAKSIATALRTVAEKASTTPNIDDEETIAAGFAP